MSGDAQQLVSWEKQRAKFKTDEDGRFAGGDFAAYRRVLKYDARLAAREAVKDAAEAKNRKDLQSKPAEPVIKRPVSAVQGAPSSVESSVQLNARTPEEPPVVFDTSGDIRYVRDVLMIEGVLTVQYIDGTTSVIPTEECP